MIPLGDIQGSVRRIGDGIRVWPLGSIEPSMNERNVPDSRILKQ